ncbi:6-phosphogluconolactonase [Shinella sp.]|uniref:6-phosphogluconolactonase n=1 Tax=Shinella sp. TaxID=1870904 RepID=UPI00258F9F7A|nr:6-phosphogluconolactonase [Shinella sp.]MCW5707908.1 6-phosphogluconolactonase [Shinella sp.]
MKTMIHHTPEAIGAHLSARILAEIGAANAAGRPYVLGCPGGRSPMPVYQALERQLTAAPVDCSRLVIAMMDEYLLPDGDGLSPPATSAHYSCRGFGEREIVGRINRALPDALRMPETNFRMPSLTDPAAYDGELATLGGIDLFLLASGAGDGHIAFNPPGSARNSRTRIVTLAEQTRRDNLATFPDFRGIEEVPTHGLTIGIGSIATLSKAVAMIVWGDGKREAFRRLSAATAYDPSWPATILVECRNGELHADAAAGARP